MNWLKKNWLGKYQLDLNWLRLVLQSRIIRIAAATAVLFVTPPAWPQNEGAGTPNPENALNRETVAGFFARFSRPQAAQAAPRTSQKPTQRVRMSHPKAVVAAPAPEIVAQQQGSTPEVQPQPEPVWPVAQDNVGAAGLVPVVVRTVREMVETEPEMPPMPEGRWSDLDLAPRPVAASRDDAIRDEPALVTDGRADADDAEWRGNQIMAFAENLKLTGAAAWLEPVLLMLAGAVAALTAMRVFAA